METASARRSGKDHATTLGPLAALTVLGYLLIPAIPWLLEHPALLVALNPKAVLLVIVAPNIALLPFVVIGTIRMCLADPFSYRVGSQYGTSAREKVTKTRLGRMLVRRVGVERRACGLAVAVHPSQSVLIWAGSLGLSIRYVIVADVLATVAYLFLMHQGIGILV